jgi:hypothetical protein
MKAMTINTSLVELNLSDNKFGEQDQLISTVCEVLKDSPTNLFMIDLKYNDIGELGVSRLIEAIKTHKKTKIDVTDRFKKETSDELNALLKGIKQKKGKKKGGMASKSPNKKK